MNYFDKKPNSFKTFANLLVIYDGFHLITSFNLSIKPNNIQFGLLFIRMCLYLQVYQLVILKHV